jgi:hypothetical protein
MRELYAAQEVLEAQVGALRSAWLRNLHAESYYHSANFCYAPIPSMIFT